MKRLNDKEWEKQKKRIAKVFNKWIKQIGGGWWEITTAYDQAVEGDSEFAAYVKVEWQYRLATITFNLNIIEQISDEKLDYVMLHEFAHILVNEMREMKDHERFEDAVAHEERVVHDVANAIIWAVQNVKD